MDIASLKPSERTIEILHPVHDTPIGLRVFLVSTDDPKMKKLRRKFIDRDQELAKKRKPASGEEMLQRYDEIAFNATQGWEWYNPTGKEGDDGYDADAHATFNGEVPDFNQRNFYNVIRELGWVKTQIQEALDETKDFFKV